jgi:hypothetical protein
LFNPTKTHQKFITENQYQIRIGGRVPLDAVNLAYSYGPPLNPTENVQIADTSGFILENIAADQVIDLDLYPNESYLLTKIDGVTSTIDSRNFLLTNVFKDNTPLYYVYKLSYPIVDSSTLDSEGFYTGTAISLINRIGRKLSSDYKYRISLNATATSKIFDVFVFTEFQTQPSDEIKVIYTAYDNGKLKPAFTELLNPQPAFKRVDDITQVTVLGTNFVYYQANGYALDQSQIYVSTVKPETSPNKRFSARISDSRQIRVTAPAERYVNENWYIRVNNGKFDRQALTTSGFPVRYRYSVPEYYKQKFDSTLGMPYRLVTGEKPEIVGDRKIKLRYTPLYVTPDTITVTVNAIPAVVRGWNITEGTLDIDTQVKDSDAIVVSYYYLENAYTYRGYWDEENQRYWHLDLNPGHGHSYTDINKDTGEIQDVPTFGLINKTVYIYMKPNARFTDSGDMVRGSYEPQVLFHGFEDIQTSNIILLAKIQVRPNSSLDSLNIIDTRLRGGGLKESIGKKLMRELNPESEFYWDIGYWDGEPYSENGVMVIRLPKYLLQENGGRFNKEEVELIAQRHVGFGNLVIVQFVDEPEQIMDSPDNPSGNPTP